MLLILIDSIQQKIETKPSELVASSVKICNWRLYYSHISWSPITSNMLSIPNPIPQTYLLIAIPEYYWPHVWLIITMSSSLKMEIIQNGKKLFAVKSKPQIMVFLVKGKVNW